MSEDGITVSTPAPRRLSIPRSALNMHKTCVIFGNGVGPAVSGGSDAGLVPNWLESVDGSGRITSASASEAPSDSRRLLSPHSTLAMLDIWLTINCN